MFKKCEILQYTLFGKIGIHKTINLKHSFQQKRNFRNVVFSKSGILCCKIQKKHSEIDPNLSQIGGDVPKPPPAGRRQDGKGTPKSTKTCQDEKIVVSSQINRGNVVLGGGCIPK